MRAIKNVTSSWNWPNLSASNCCTCPPTRPTSISSNACGNSSRRIVCTRPITTTLRSSNRPSHPVSLKLKPHTGPPSTPCFPTASRPLKNQKLCQGRVYRAKGEGRGTYHFYEEGLDTTLQERRNTEAALRNALLEGEFRLEFQPPVNLVDNRVCAFEALLRWQHPERGLLAPGAFMPAAEESGLIAPIGEWVLREACALASTWPDHIGAAVNLSPIQFRKNRKLVEQVKSALSAAALPPGRLELEITESVLLADDESAVLVLRELKKLGVRIALDDFGTGYSSLSYLRRFPFDKIKIDRTFVQESSENADSLAIVKAVIALGRSLGMATVAEGVETEAQLDIVSEQGCTEVQGYLFSVPLPAQLVNEFAARLNPRKSEVRGTKLAS